MAFGGHEGVVAGVVLQRRGESVYRIAAQDRSSRLGTGNSGSPDGDVLAQEFDGARQVVRELVAQADAAAYAVFRPFRVNSLVVETADAEHQRQVVQVRVLVADHVALHLGAGHQLHAEALARAAQGAALPDVFPAIGHVAPVEVLLVDGDVAHQSGVGVHAHAEHQAGRSGSLPGRSAYPAVAERDAGGLWKHRRLWIAEDPVAVGPFRRTGDRCRDRRANRWAAADAAAGRRRATSA